MKYRTLPGTELNVSGVCLGTMTWGEQNSEAEAHAQLDYAVAQGINFIDTAEMYPVPPNAETQGRTETYLGTWLARQPRDRLVIATKVAGPGRRDWIRGGRTDLTRDVIAEAVDTSLARLQTDYIDLYQIHWPQRNVPMFGATEFDPAKEKGGPSIHEQVEGMAALIKAGKIRHYGLSNETAWGVCEFRRAARELGVPGPVTLQNSYSLVSRNVDNDLAETLFREKMSLLAYSPLGGGMLSGKYLGGAKPPDARFTLFDFARHALSQADGLRSGGGVREARQAARADAGATGPGLRGEPLVPRRVDHRRDVDGATRRRHRRRAVRARRGDAGGDRGDSAAISESGGLTGRRWAGTRSARMLSYRHAFHAGNHADVLKHVVLVQLLRHLTQKDKPLWVIDTHAGAGSYSLEQGYAAKNAEFETGIAAVDAPRPARTARRLREPGEGGQSRRQAAQLSRLAADRAAAHAPAGPPAPVRAAPHRGQALQEQFAAPAGAWRSSRAMASRE